MWPSASATTASYPSAASPTPSATRTSSGQTPDRQHRRDRRCQRGRAPAKDALSCPDSARRAVVMALCPRDPACGDRVLSLREAHLPLTNEPVKLVLNRVLWVGRGTRLRPEVAGVIGRAAELQRNEMVVLVSALRAGVAVGDDARGLLLLGDALIRPHSLRPAAAADRLVYRL